MTMELNELKVICKLQEHTHDDIDITITGDGILHVKFDGSSIKLVIKNGVVVGVEHG